MNNSTLFVGLFSDVRPYRTSAIVAINVVSIRDHHVILLVIKLIIHTFVSALQESCIIETTLPHTIHFLVIRTL